MRVEAVVIAVLGLTGGGAAAISLPQALHRATQPVHAAPPVAAPMPGRVLVNATDMRQAMAAGLLDRPVKTMLDVRSPLKYGEFRWDEKGVPAGPAWVRVDLKSQIISVFRSGHEIGTAVILYGAESKETPVGKFPIQAKLKDHHSATYDQAPMPYTLRLTGDGVSIHGSNVRWGYATHGCIGVPLEFAEKLFSAVKTGEDVVILAGKARARA